MSGAEGTGDGQQRAAPAGAGAGTGDAREMDDADAGPPVQYAADEFSDGEVGDEADAWLGQ
jgi:hypothetical protein